MFSNSKFSNSKLRRFPYRNIHLTICGLVTILDGLILVLSFGFFQANLEMRYLVWVNEKEYNAINQ